MSEQPKQKRGRGRPAKAPEDRRVVLPAQRVTGSTLGRLRALAGEFGGVGRVIDYVVEEDAREEARRGRAKAPAMKGGTP